MNSALSHGIAILCEDGLPFFAPLLAARYYNRTLANVRVEWTI